MTDREIMQQAFDALMCNTENLQTGMSRSIQKLQAKTNLEVIDDLRQALAQPEPVQVRPHEFIAMASLKAINL